MTDTNINGDLITLTADIVSAHVANNAVHTADVGKLIATVHEALASLGAPVAAAEPERPKAAVSARASIKPGHLVSMIDGKPYKMLKRHISQHGYTPDSYREAFGLARDYPMVASDYAEQRRALAHKIGLGRKQTPAPKASSNRGRKPKVLSEAIASAKEHLSN